VLGEEIAEPKTRLNVAQEADDLREHAEAEPIAEESESGGLDLEEEPIDLDEPDDSDLEEIEVEEEEDADLLAWGAELGDDPVRMYLKEIARCGCSIPIRNCGWRRR
jgi:hypothetical protein